MSWSEGDQLSVKGTEKQIWEIGEGSKEGGVMGRWTYGQVNG